MKFQWWLMAVGIVLYCVVISCENGGSGGDAKSDDDADPGSCDIDDSSMVEIPFSFDGSDCGALGLAIVVDRLYANSTLTAFRVAGQFSIDNDNVFYLRTSGVAQQDPCYDKIENSGTFEIGASYFECTTSVQVDVAASTDSDASSFCGFWVQSGVACEDGGDDDYSDDDTDDDDDSDEECVETLSDNVEACFDGYTTEEVCAFADADCWVACFLSGSVETCEDWLDCLVSDCGYTTDDDDSDDDDGGDYCGDVVAAFVAYCPEFDYDSIYQIVCVDNGDPECLEYCYNAYDDCLDIGNCYDTDECVG